MGLENLLPEGAIRALDKGKEVWGQHCPGVEVVNFLRREDVAGVSAQHVRHVIELPWLVRNCEVKLGQFKMPTRLPLVHSVGALVVFKCFVISAN